MKNRRNVVIAILLIAVLCVGIGYAAMDSFVTFNGKITYAPEFEILWEAVQDTNNILDPAKTEGEGTNLLKVGMDASEWKVNEPKTFTATIKNMSKYDAIDVAIADEVDPANFNVTVTPDKTTIAAGGTDLVTVTITVTMTDYPAVDASTDFDFSFKVTAKQDV